MSRTTGVVEGGRIVLPDGIRLPDGAQVFVEWNEDQPDWGPPLEREPWTEEEVLKEIERARSTRWSF